MTPYLNTTENRFDSQMALKVVSNKRWIRYVIMEKGSGLTFQHHPYNIGMLDLPRGSLLNNDLEKPD